MVISNLSMLQTNALLTHYVGIDKESMVRNSLAQKMYFAVLFVYA